MVMHKVVHVIPVGPNKESILESIKKSGYPIQKAYLVLNKGYVDREHKIADELEENLKALVNVKRILVDFIVYNAAQEILKVIKREQEEGNIVLVNATGSTNILCIACYIAAQLSGSTFYWKLDDVVPRVSSVAELQLPSTKEVNKDRLEIIKTLQDNGGSVSSLKELIEIIEGKSEQKKEYMAQRARINHYLKSLEKDNLIEMGRRGKKVEVELTELGWAYAAIS